MHELEEKEEVWSIKKIGIALVFFGALIYAGYIFLWPYIQNQQMAFEKEQASRVKGFSTQEGGLQRFSVGSVSDVRSAVEDRVRELTNQVNNLNPAEIATSSAQVQKVLSDLKNLEQYPKNQIQEACLNMCSKLPK